MVALGPGPGARSLAEPPGRRALRVPRGTGPGGARRARAPQRHPRSRALAALDAPDPAPEPGLAAPATPPLTRVPLLPAARARLPRGSRGPDRDHPGPVAPGRAHSLRPRLPPLPDRRYRDG